MAPIQTRIGLASTVRFTQAEDAWADIRSAVPTTGTQAQTPGNCMLALIYATPKSKRIAPIAAR